MRNNVSIADAESIAKKYGCDQVVVLTRNVSSYDQVGGWAFATYGKDRANCEVALKIGQIFQDLENGKYELRKVSKRKR